MHSVRAINDRPYSMGHTGLEIVGEGLDPPGSTILRFFNVFGEWKLSSKSVILSDQRESKDLRAIDTARILRFAALTQDDKERNILRFHIGFQRIRSYILCGRSMIAPTVWDTLG